MTGHVEVEARAIDLARLRGAIGCGLLDARKIGGGELAVAAREFSGLAERTLLGVEHRLLRFERADRLLGHRDLLLDGQWTVLRLLEDFDQPGAALGKLRHFIDLHPEAVLIATCRRANNGGKFRGSLAAQVEVLGEGWSLVRREYPTAIGPVDLLCRDADGATVAVEISTRVPRDSAMRMAGML